MVDSRATRLMRAPLDGRGYYRTSLWTRRKAVWRCLWITSFSGSFRALLRECSDPRDLLPTSDACACSSLVFRLKFWWIMIATNDHRRRFSLYASSRLFPWMRSGNSERHARRRLRVSTMSEEGELDDRSPRLRGECELPLFRGRTSSRGGRGFAKRPSWAYYLPPKGRSRPAERWRSDAARKVMSI